MDTSVVVPHLCGDYSLSARLAQVASTHMPWVVLGELRFGAQRAVRPLEALAQVRAFLRTVVLLLPDEGTAEHYGDLKAELARVGKPIPDNDLWIAATARQYDLPLATRDAHFAQVPRLKTLAW
ncbi:MAG: type II toxin-antitoxin system VapC family toxin [Acidobacteria bacterium]|nr:type II toxin-antitoxin system VapC family toxin [Acidobacteriota bacterium]